MPNVKKTARKAGAKKMATAGKEPLSLDLAREINRDLILALIRLHQPVARVELARASGLQNSTVSSLVEQLIAENWIREGETLRTARGRRPMQISLNSALAMMVADVRGSHAVLGVVDLNGCVLESEEIPLAEDRKAGPKDLAAALLRLRGQHPGSTFIGAGVCSPGRVDDPGLHWKDHPIQKLLGDRLKLRVELESDANACLLAELWFGNLNGVNDAVLLAVSDGIAASLLADGNLVGGRLSMAGAVGHICFDPRGPLCGCGRRGCWELFASSRAALRYYAELQPAAPRDYAALAQLAQAGDPHACAAVVRQAEALGRGLRIVTAALDPQVILFSGEISQNWHLVAPILERAARDGMLAGTPPRLVSTGTSSLTQLRGVAAAVLQHHPGYYRSHTSGRVGNIPGMHAEATR